MPNNSIAEYGFLEAARAFCGLIEQIENHELGNWLTHMGKVVLRLEASMELLAMPAGSSPCAGVPEESLFKLYARLREFLGERDEYWSEGDLHAGDGDRTGSLSDDFADIYFEITRGMALYRQGKAFREQALRLWIGSYRKHWRQHLIDVRKQLNDFCG